MSTLFFYYAFYPGLTLLFLPQFIVNELATVSNMANDNYPNPIYAWYVAAVLMVANVVSFIDRQIISLLIEPIKADLSITDTQISILHGFAFAIFYAFMGIPIGRLADSKNRRTIIAIGITAWSLMTACCGLAKNFWMFFLARIGVGVGEACLSPCGYSMVSDYFPRDKRSKPISLLAMGPYVGGGLSFILGGLVVQAVAKSTALELPLVGVLQPWQTTLIIVGLPGVLVAALVMLSVKEPLRHDRLNKGEGAPILLPLRETFRFMASHLRVYLTIIFGYSTTAMLGYGLLAWTPTLFIRIFSWTPGEVGIAFGLVVLFFGGGGTMCGGIWADWLIKRGFDDAYLRVSVYACLGLLIFIVTPLAPNSLTVLCLLGPTMFFLGANIGVGMACITQITPNEFRGQILAIYLFILVLIGAGVGPFLVAYFTDTVFQNTLQVHYSLSLFGAIFIPIAIVIFYLGLKPFANMIVEIRHS